MKKEFKAGFDFVIKHGLSNQSLILLNTLSESNKTLNELSTETKMEYGNVSRIVTLLRKKGLVRIYDKNCKNKLVYALKTDGVEL
ncbi:MAG: MarR family transcriptional regulator [Nanoarchaeota archaeon]|nr:MarR family transcriptional regulator [Nanoarchaeota archaeon]